LVAYSILNPCKYNAGKKKIEIRYLKVGCMPYESSFSNSP